MPNFDDDFDWPSNDQWTKIIKALPKTPKRKKDIYGAERWEDTRQEWTGTEWRKLPPKLKKGYPRIYSFDPYPGD